jgi:hypothetical protein
MIDRVAFSALAFASKAGGITDPFNDRAGQGALR